MIPDIRSRLYYRDVTVLNVDVYGYDLEHYYYDCEYLFMDVSDEVVPYCEDPLPVGSVPKILYMCRPGWINQDGFVTDRPIVYSGFVLRRGSEFTLHLFVDIDKYDMIDVDYFKRDIAIFTFLSSYKACVVYSNCLELHRSVIEPFNPYLAY